MKHKTAFQPVDRIVDRIELRATAEGYGRKAAACEAIANACDELGIGAETFDADATELRQRQRDTMKFIRGLI